MRPLYWPYWGLSVLFALAGVAAVIAGIGMVAMGHAEWLPIALQLQARH